MLLHRARAWATARGDLLVGTASTSRASRTAAHLHGGRLHPHRAGLPGSEQPQPRRDDVAVVVGAEVPCMTYSTCPAPPPHPASGLVAQGRVVAISPPPSPKSRAFGVASAISARDVGVRPVHEDLLAGHGQCVGRAPMWSSRTRSRLGRRPRQVPAPAGAAGQRGDLCVPCPGQRGRPLLGGRGHLATVRVRKVAATQPAGRRPPSGIWTRDQEQSVGHQVSQQGQAEATTAGSGRSRSVAMAPSACRAVRVPSHTPTRPAPTVSSRTTPPRPPPWRSWMTSGSAAPGRPCRSSVTSGGAGPGDVEERVVVVLGQPGPRGEGRVDDGGPIAPCHRSAMVDQVRPGWTVPAGRWRATTRSRPARRRGRRSRPATPRTGPRTPASRCASLRPRPTARRTRRGPARRVPPRRRARFHVEPGRPDVAPGLAGADLPVADEEGRHRVPGGRRRCRPVAGRRRHRPARRRGTRRSAHPGGAA